jgi:hypothetical protein
MVVVGTFFNVQQCIFCIASHEMVLGDDKNARGMLLNEFIYFKESGIMKAPIFSFAGGDDKKLVQTHDGLYVYPNNLETVVLVSNPHSHKLTLALTD